MVAGKREFSIVHFGEIDRQDVVSPFCGRAERDWGRSDQYLWIKLFCIINVFLTCIAVRESLVG